MIIEEIKDKNIKEMNTYIYDINARFINEIKKVIDTDKYNNAINNFLTTSRALTLDMYGIDKDEMNQDVYCHRISINIGSLLEGVLQFFLLAYIKDYNDLNWKKWSDCDIEELKNYLNSRLDLLVKDKKITGEQKRSIKDVIGKELKIRLNGKQIEYIMLDELIGLYRSNDILLEKMNDSVDYNMYDLMSKIRDGRNSIHIFTKSHKLNIEELTELVKVYYCIVDDLLYRILCLNEEKTNDNYQKKL